MDVIRRLLSETEESYQTRMIQDNPIDVYHYYLLEDGGYIDAKIVSGEQGQPMCALVFNLTNKGHDFLEDSRNDTVWNRVKKELVEKGSGASLEVFQALLKAYALVHFGLKGD